MKYLAKAIVPAIYDANLAGKNIEATTEDAQETTRRLTREIRARERLCRHSIDKRIKVNVVIITVLCDGDGKYLSEILGTKLKSIFCRLSFVCGSLKNQ